MNRPLVALIASSLALEAFAQRVDLGLNGFRPLPDTQVQLVLPWLVVITNSPTAGGADRCIDFQGPPPSRFGGIGFVPNKNPNGQPNRGRGGIALVPFTEPGCTGNQLPLVSAAPMFDDSTPRDVEFPMSFTGGLPATAKSALFLIGLATNSPNSFQFCFREPWLESGAPDLDPDVTIHVGNFVMTNPGSAHPGFALHAQSGAMGQGDVLPRGRLLLMYIDVKNVGTAEAKAWMVTVRPPAGWQFSSLASNCNDFNAGGIHNANAGLGPGATRRLCAALMPNKAAAAVRVSAETSVANDSNPANNLSSSDFFEVEAPRDAAPLPEKILNYLNGRR